MQMAIHFLSLDRDSLREEINKAISENPALEYVPARRTPSRPNMRGAANYGGGGGEQAMMANIPAAEETQLTDLEQQLRLSGQPADIVSTARYMLRQLTPRGYFTQDIGEFAAECGVSADTARGALKAVQALEPTGIGARNVEECLELQLRQRMDADPLCYDLIRQYLPELARGNIRQVAVKAGASVARVRQCLMTIRSLNPIPCSLDEESIRYITPEFSVDVSAGNQLTIEFHNDFCSLLRRDETFSRLAGTLPDNERRDARRMLAAASQLISAVQMRQATMEKIARVIVREQSAFFLGFYNLVPLRIDETAREIGVHETTVYRALQGKYLYCSKGFLPLAQFFQHELPGGSSAMAVKDMILALCREKESLSDRAIAEALGKRGVSLSRRTVTKYRSQMDIDCSFRREEAQKG